MKRALWWAAPLALLIGVMPWVPTGAVPLLAAAQALTPFAAAFALFIGLIFTFRRRWVAAAVLLTAVISCAIPLLGLTTLTTDAPSQQTTRGFSVLALNCEVASADAASIRALMTTRKPAAVVLVETDEFLIADVLTPALQRDYPYRTGRVSGDGISGTVILSRYPLTEASPAPATSFESRVAALDLGPAGTLNLVAVHPFPPIDGAGTWHRDLAALRSLQQRLTPPAVMVGDFNAIAAHPEFRALLGPMADAGAPAGTLPAATWPDRLPVLTIDHALHSRALTVQHFETVDVPGTDHRGTLTTFN